MFRNCNFIRCYYILTADPSINIQRVKSRVKAGGHDVPEDKIIVRYDRALELVKYVVSISDVCHIYDNSENKPYRIFKKKKNDLFFDECDDWLKEDIDALTGTTDAKKINLNIL